VLSSRKSFVGKHCKIEGWLCSRLLSSLYGFVNSINKLDLEIKSIGEERIRMIAGIVSSSLSTLSLDFNGVDTSTSDILEIFFGQCDIRNLRITSGIILIPVVVSPTIEAGFKPLRQLEFFKCSGNLRNFLSRVKILSLSIFSFESLDEIAEECDLLISFIAENYRNIQDLYLFAPFISTTSLLKLFKSCHGLENLTLYDSGLLLLNTRDMKAISDLPLVYFDSNCKIAVDALPFLSKMKSLNHIILDVHVDLNTTLPSIGKKLVSLGLQIATIKTIDAIMLHCPNLQYLSIIREVGDDVNVDRIKQVVLRNGLKRLASLIVNDVSVRLGTDWKGYRGESV
jgi:hypothetical protein